MSPGRLATWRGATSTRQQLGEDGEQLEHGVRLAPGDVVGAPDTRLGGCGGGAQVGLDRVGDVREVAALPTVAVDLDGRPRRSASMKRGTTAAYWLSARWRGPNTLKYRRHHRLEAVQLGEDPGVVLAGELAHRVRRPGLQRLVLAGRALPGAAVHRRRRRQHDPAHAGVVRRAQHVERAADVRPVRLERLLDGALDRAAGGEVEHDVAAAHQRRRPRRDR